jgi:hypothetical protein
MHHYGTQLDLNRTHHVLKTESRLFKVERNGFSLLISSPMLLLLFLESLRAGLVMAREMFIFQLLFLPELYIHCKEFSTCVHIYNLKLHLSREKTQNIGIFKLFMLP